MTLAELAYKISAVDSNDENDLVIQELSQVYYIAARIRERLPQQVDCYRPSRSRSQLR